MVFSILPKVWIAQLFKRNFLPLDMWTINNKIKGIYVNHMNWQVVCDESRIFSENLAMSIDK